MINPNDCLQLYTAIKLHFSTEDYSFVKYNGKLKHPPKFNKRKDAPFFSWLAKKPDPTGILIANLSKNPNLWVGNMLHQPAMDTYYDWKKRNESLTYTFQEEFRKLADNFPKKFIITDGQHPDALKLYIRGEVSIETLTIVDVLLGFMHNWDKHLAHDPVWKQHRLPLLKYRAFMKLDSKNFEQIMLQIIKDSIPKPPERPRYVEYDLSRPIKGQIDVRK